MAEQVPMLQLVEHEWDNDGASSDGTPFAADVRMACLPLQCTPLLSVHDLDRSLKLFGGFAEVHWGDESLLMVGDGNSYFEIPLCREGAYVLLRGDTDSQLAFRVDPDGSESIIIDTGAGISCCGPSCKFFSEPTEAPAALRLVGANKSPLPVQSVGKLRLIFGEPRWLSWGPH